MNRSIQWGRLIAESAKGLARKSLGPGDRLIGPGATIDSLDFLNFLVRLEEMARAEAGEHVPVLEERTLERILREAFTVSDLERILGEIRS